MKKLFSLFMLAVVLLFTTSTGLRGSTPDLDKKSEIKVSTLTKVEKQVVVIKTLKAKEADATLPTLMGEVPKSQTKYNFSFSVIEVPAKSANLKISENYRNARDSLMY